MYYLFANTVGQHSIDRPRVDELCQLMKVVLDVFPMGPGRFARQNTGPESLSIVALLDVVPALESRLHFPETLLAQPQNILSGYRKLPSKADGDDLLG